MPAFEDLTNMRFGKLLVVRRMPDYIQPSGQHRRIWHCVCDCGNECDVRAGDLKSGNTQSCGCYKEAARGQSTFKDLVGQTFGLWTVISRAENHVTPSGQKQRMWNCRCQCGTEKVIYGTVLMRGNTSCGCERRKAAIQRKQEREKQNHEGKEVSQGRREKASLGIKTTSRLKHGINDLESQCPDLVPEWNLQRNAPLFPNQVSIGSGKKVWWICKQGHEWQAIISSRVHGNGCPYCSGQKILPGFNDLFTMNPELAAQWHPQKNQPLMPDQVSCGGNRKVWWLGPCGHEWQASIGNRANGTGCPYCNKGVLLKGFNDLKTINPALAEQWNYEKNQSMTPEQIYAYSGTNVWWLGLCGHEWQMSVGARTRGSGCPFCSSERLLIGFNDFATKFPHLAQEWHPTRNGVTKPSEIMTGTKHKYWWLCSQGHEYQKLPYNKVLSPQCPICNKGQHTSFPEQAIFYYVSQVFQDTVNSDQHIGMELDIFIPSIRTAVEYDGLHWHTNNNREKKKNTLCQQHGITLIRIRESGLAPYDDCKCLYRDPKTLECVSKLIKREKP